MIRYSDNQNDLSTCKSLEEYEFKLNQSVEKLYRSVRPGRLMAILIRDKRKQGSYYALFRTLLVNSRIGQLKAIIIKVQHTVRATESRNPAYIRARYLDTVASIRVLVQVTLGGMHSHGWQFLIKLVSY